MKNFSFLMEFVAKNLDAAGKPKPMKIRLVPFTKESGRNFHDGKYTLYVFDLVLGEEKIGAQLSVKFTGGDKTSAKVNIFGHAEHKLGTRGVRALIAAVKKRFPTLEHVYGDRISGARAQSKKLDRNAQVLIAELDQDIETLAAPPRHDDVGFFVRDAFQKARMPLKPADVIDVLGKPGIGTGFVVKVLTTTKRELGFKQIMRLRAYMHQAFEIKDLKVTPGMHRGKAVMEYVFLVIRLKRSRKKDKR